MSQILSASALKSINRIGDILLPQNGEFPSFSETGCIEHIDDIVAYAPPADIKDLNMVLSILAPMPGALFNWLVKKMNTSKDNNGPLGSLFRQLDFGLRGIIFTLYYSGKTGSGYTGKNPLDVIEFSIDRLPVAE